jgi:hypothetical protein
LRRPILPLFVILPSSSGMPRTRKQTKAERCDLEVDKNDTVMTLENFERVEKGLITSPGKFGECSSEEILCPQR